MLKLPTFDNSHALKAKNICTVCREVPDYTTLYKCNMGGHIICNPCFIKLPRTGGPRCSKCNSIFLKIRNNHKSVACQKKPITVEELFQLPSEQVHLLLNKNSLDKLEGNQDVTPCNSDLINALKKNQQMNNSQIWKPLKCPQLSCGKTVNSSSLKVHFMYEHSDITTYTVKRGDELHVVSNVSIIEYGTSHCIGMIEIYDEYKFVSRSLNGLYKKDTQRVPVALFWIMVSGSHETEKSKAYALYWLVTDAELPFKCTLEMSSPASTSSCATFCGVNDVRDNLSVSEIARKMNALYLSYGSLTNLKGMWGEANLSITIH